MACRYVKPIRHLTYWGDSDDEIENDSTDVDNTFLLFEEIRKNYNHYGLLVGDLEQSQIGKTTRKDTENAFKEAITNLHNANTDDRRSCASCCTAIRVEDASMFAPGQHISMPGNFSNYLISYRHHAIVKEVNHTSGTYVTLQLIEFAKEGMIKNIYKSEKKFNLSHDQIYIIQYRRPRHTTEDIVRRAESMLPENMEESCKFDTYNPLTNNCEHFATWCVVGEGQSFQVQDIRKMIHNGLQYLQSVLNGNRIVRYLYKILYVSSDEMAGILTNSLGGLGQGITLGATTALYLIYCIVTTVVHINDYKKGSMCRYCIERKLWDMWLDFFTFSSISVASYLIISFAIPLVSSGFVLPLGILTVLLAIALQWSVSKVRRMLLSPLQADTNVVENMSEIDIGDIISMKYWGIPHDLIVTDLEKLTTSSAKIKCVHYGLPTWNIFGTRKILEEEFRVNLSETSVKKYDCRHLFTYKKEEVAQRARKRVGETKWEIKSNRSIHLCYWAKVRQLPRPNCDDSINYSHCASTLGSIFLEENEVHIFSELQLGDAIKYDVTGILVGKTSSDSGYGRFFEIELMIWTFWKGVHCKKYTIDLNRNKLIVIRYNPAYCRPLKDRLIFAKSAEGRRFLNLAFGGFMESCIMNGHDRVGVHIYDRVGVYI